MAKFMIYFTNFHYFADPIFYTFSDAIRYGISKGFEFQVHTEKGVDATWSPLGGLKLCPLESKVNA